MLNWAAGMTLLWGLVTTIWLPYLDSRRSYRGRSRERCGVHLPPQGCVASRNLGEPQRALFHYFAGLVTVREEVAAAGTTARRCSSSTAACAATPAPPTGMRGCGSGSRRGDDTERFVLYARTPR